MSEAELVRSNWANDHDDLKHYYDTEWGMPVFDENGVFERLSLEAFQSGLSWLTILRKRENFRVAFAGFDIAAVAAFDESDVARLLADAGIIRNRAKIIATINNANAILNLHKRGFNVADLVWSYMPEHSPSPTHDGEVPATSAESIALAKALKKQGFAFVGPTTAYALMTAIGIADVHLVSSHRRACSGLWQANGERTDEGERVSVAARAGVAGLLGRSHQ
ncbi:DNA-3-methyladenine glycosylase I [Leucobacter sp. UT-8R-CII-1-4]|uniref:DNA-3-methyladenine glycosylase I n=1 Tax=Leucobacter sp. UT-8R-CII-1-4 TaxID=3040075 RepID=UPI0024A8DC08|nr:DNA-3-methyladenine glycosylase I [Leucobacter sp. UT-8R-CII-1-4]MDI6022901.1 DNA-3-methyladenine glycosylase I [Leucobacter sp. UT-8R-CII-1-4]